MKTCIISDHEQMPNSCPLFIIYDLNESDFILHYRSSVPTECSLSVNILYSAPCRVQKIKRNFKVNYLILRVHKKNTKLEPVIYSLLTQIVSKLFIVEHAWLFWLEGMMTIRHCSPQTQCSMIEKIHRYNEIKEHDRVRSMPSYLQLYILSVLIVCHMIQNVIVVLFMEISLTKRWCN